MGPVLQKLDVQKDSKSHKESHRVQKDSRKARVAVAQKDLLDQQMEYAQKDIMKAQSVH